MNSFFERKRQEARSRKAAQPVVAFAVDLLLGRDRPVDGRVHDPVDC